MLRVLKSGFYSTIQDVGRIGYRQYGVPVSGAMDLYSAQFANALLGNDKNAALIEMTMIGGEFQFTLPSMIVISGADMSARLNGKLVPVNTVLSVKSEDVLSLGKAEKGFRTYLAVKDGFKSENILNSQSQYEPLTRIGNIKKAETVKYLEFKNKFGASKASVKYDNSVLTSRVLEVHKGPEFKNLSSGQVKKLFATKLKISKLNNRMAYQLEPLLENRLESILTSPVLPGTVQLTPKGSLIVLMRDCQTTGGYPRVLQLTERAINILSQKTSGNTINLRLKE